MADNSYISRIVLPSGGDYFIKDEEARAKIVEILETVSGVMHYIGVTTTALVDGSTTDPIKINGEDVSPESGDVVIYGNSGVDGDAPKEFVWNGSKWNEFGSTGSLKALAFKSSASASYTPGGSISTPQFTGTGGTISVSGTPEGSVSSNFSGSTTTVTVTGSVASAAIDITSTATTGAINYTPQGTISQPNFQGSTETVVISGGGGTSTYTPEGTISTPTITVSPTTQLVTAVVNTGTLPSLSMNVNNDVLTFSWDAGALTTVTGVDVLTNITATSSTPEFTGTGTRLTGTSTPAGTISTPSFNGTGARLRATISGTVTSTGLYTPSGSVESTFTGNTITSTGEFTPAGTISTPQFTGTGATITVS